MCGIMGWVSTTETIQKEFIQAATSTLEHRGPDDFGYFSNEKNTVHFGHRRLSIIDLSSASSQPFYSKCGRYVMVYNGEIYNFREVAQQLNLELSTQGDTEVILEAFIKKGVQSFELLNGMFAFAIYDTQEEKIYLCRDRVGIKPLFYYFHENKFVFASEIKAIKKIPGLKLDINFESFAGFLHVGFIPAPQTAYKHIYKFPAGNYLILDTKNISSNNKLSFEKFWNLYDNLLPETYKNEAAVEKKLEELLIKSIESQIISDVPLGSFLSGGIDSSLVSALTSKVKPGKLKTFSIGYQNSKFDESKYAENVAKTLGTEHYAYKMTEQDLEEIMLDIITSFDEPFSDSSAFPTMLVSKFARKHVTVSLSGDGGDELFMGYGAYRWADRLENPFIKNSRKPLFWSSQFLSNKFKRAGWLLNYKDYQNITSHIFSQEQYLFGEKDLKHYLINETFDFHNLNYTPTTKRTLTPREKQACWDIQYYLRDDLLVKVDRATMRYSLESRVPILDNDIINYAINIDQSLKYKNGESKYILKKVLYKYLPKELFNRPKRGFSIPLNDWMKGRLRYLIDKYLSPVVINRYDIVASLYVEELKKRYFNGEDYLYSRIWVLVLLHWWLEENA
jgi:asparagine synthase (glutamine-hydrolysing)